mmetsp:Transcript_82776/g.146031  ORF Transcript_82776/g.146031 Transcript_82776/m.146031 type:complete len:272 (+) Transcript_82776:93-908(+)
MEDLKHENLEAKVADLERQVTEHRWVSSLLLLVVLGPGFLDLTQTCAVFPPGPTAVHRNVFLEELLVHHIQLFFVLCFCCYLWLYGCYLAVVSIAKGFGNPGDAPWQAKVVMRFMALSMCAIFSFCHPSSKQNIISFFSAPSLIGTLIPTTLQVSTACTGVLATMEHLGAMNLPGFALGGLLVARVPTLIVLLMQFGSGYGCAAREFPLDCIIYTWYCTLWTLPMGLFMCKIWSMDESIAHKYLHLLVPHVDCGQPVWGDHGAIRLGMGAG